MPKILEGLNTEQRQAIEQIKGALLAMAPVGTGKTKVLAHRAANAVENGIDPAKIVCLSFTNKAVREMQERIVSFLGGPGGPGGRKNPAARSTLFDVCNGVKGRWEYKI